jgi:hypothetical protein
MLKRTAFDLVIEGRFLFERGVRSAHRSTQLGLDTLALTST